VFGAAAVLALAHALDDAFLLPGADVAVGRHALAAGIALAATVAAVVCFERLRPGLRALVAFTFGVLATLNGGRHVHHFLHESLTANDVTGALALGAGVVMLGLAAWIPFRHRGEGASNPVVRLAIRVAIVPAFLLTAVFVYAPVGMGLVDEHILHRAVGSPPDASYETVRFETSDGVDLEGWYRPSRNGASVLVITGGGGNRRGTLRHAEMLVRHGYGVLVYDPRGAGESGGTPSSYAWGWEKDADAALDYLATREPGPIGALGLSSGADAAIDVAGRRDDVAAVVADGAAAIGYKDIEGYTDDPLNRVTTWMMFKSIELMKGRSGPKVSLADQIARSRSPHLIISAGKTEKEWGELYDRAGGERSTLWYLPKASHTAALRQYPAEYEHRVVGYLDEHLGVR